MNFAIFGAGCFWCVEAVFLQLNGVIDVTPGYTGGITKNPTYEDICAGKTKHAEVCKITYDPNIIDYNTLLKYFFESHDPTTLNRQGNDIGDQYRSAIFYVNEEQKMLANKFKVNIDNSNIYNGPIVTEIKLLEKFYEAEDYHKNYYNNNKNQPYCKFVIKPKLDKIFKDNNY